MPLDYTDHPGVPHHTRGALDRYFDHGLEPGGFLKSVLTNDLVGAVLRADPENYDALSDIVAFLWNRAPSGSWGTVENYYNWIDNDCREYHNKQNP